VNVILLKCRKPGDFVVSSVGYFIENTSYW